MRLPTTVAFSTFYVGAIIKQPLTLHSASNHILFLPLRVIRKYLNGFHSLRGLTLKSFLKNFSKAQCQTTSLPVAPAERLKSACLSISFYEGKLLKCSDFKRELFIAKYLQVT